VAKAKWADVEALVRPWFEQGMTPERQDLVDLAFNQGASDDVVDALDTLGPRPVPSLQSLREQLEAAGALE
jgi:hypothetical protein